MNILVIIPYNIFAVKENSSGNAIRIQALLDTLLQNGCNITLFMYDVPWRKTIRSDSGLSACCFSIRFELLLLAFLVRKFFNTTVFDLALSKLSPIYFFKHRVRKILNQGTFDIIQCENISTASFINGLSNGIPVVVTAHDVMTKRCEQRNFWANANKLLASYCSKEMKKKETQIFKSAGFRVCVSEDDKKEFVNMGISSSALTVIPNGVDTGKIFPMKKNPALLKKLGISKRDRILMFSGSDMFHNVQAAEDIVRIILPETVKTFPHVKMIFVGEICNYIKMKNLHLLFPENIILCNYVPEINVFYSITDIYLLPAVYGTGSSLKAIEALAAGKPLISTSSGVRGFNLTHGKHYMLEDDICKFPQRITELLENLNMMKTMSAGAREIALKYDWFFLMKQYLKIYNTVLKQENVTEKGCLN